ncbi:hypothetical protein [Ilumatobacter sp.]|uniref:phage adaptor protein n=1 Tax=Ilumatobacter sp. TaxID=1967498 RepID=UPI003750BF6D
MATLDDLRALVRTQTETTASELPNTTVDWYIRQAFDRSVAAENTWPSYETKWILTLPAGATEITIPIDCNRASINSLVDVSSGLRLNMADHETAESVYGNTAHSARNPIEYSLWGKEFQLWPHTAMTEEKSYQLMGHRLPIDWVSLGGDSVVDADPRLHYPLVHYAVALAYAQQEANELEDVYMTRWQFDFNAARSAIMEPSRQQPLTFGGGKRYLRPFNSFTVNTPI